jgi:hypothetical protein
VDYKLTSSVEVEELMDGSYLIVLRVYDPMRAAYDTVFTGTEAGAVAAAGKVLRLLQGQV